MAWVRLMNYPLLFLSGETDPRGCVVKRCGGFSSLISGVRCTECKVTGTPKRLISMFFSSGWGFLDRFWACRMCSGQWYLCEKNFIYCLSVFWSICFFSFFFFFFLLSSSPNECQDDTMKLGYINGYIWDRLIGRILLTTTMVTTTECIQGYYYY